MPLLPVFPYPIPTTRVLERVRMEELDRKFPRTDMLFIHVLKNTKTCFFCQKMAELFQNLAQERVVMDPRPGVHQMG